MVGNKAQKAVAAALTGILTLGTAAPALASVKLDNGWYRLDGTYKSYDLHDEYFALIDEEKTVDGQDRYDTMLDAVLYNGKDGKWMSKEWMGLKGPDVVLVSGTSYADALSASALAGIKGAPIVTTPSGKLGNQAKLAIKFMAKQIASPYLEDLADEIAQAKLEVKAAQKNYDDAYRALVNLSKDKQEIEDQIAEVISQWSETENLLNGIEIALGDLEAHPDDNADLIQSLENDQAALQTQLDRLEQELATLSSSIPDGDQAAQDLTDAINWLTAAKDCLSRLQKIDLGKSLNVWIVGGTSAVSADVASAVEAIDVDGVKIKTARISGADRTETSLNVAYVINDFIKAGWRKSDKNYIYVANGSAWADALSVSSFAYRRGAPLILTKSDGTLTEDQISYLKDAMGKGAHVGVIGGPAKLAYDTLASLDKKVGALNYIAGSNRYDTSALVVSEYGLSGDAIAVATGENWPDALVGGAFIGARGGNLVLVGTADGIVIKGDGAKALKEAMKKGANTKDFKYILGGTSAVSKDTANILGTFV